MICSGVKDFLAMPTPFLFFSPIPGLDSFSGGRSQHKHQVGEVHAAKGEADRGHADVLTAEPTMVPKATPITTPTAISTTLPLMMNALKSCSMLSFLSTTPVCPLSATPCYTPAGPYCPITCMHWPQTVDSRGLRVEGCEFESYALDRRRPEPERCGPADGLNTQRRHE
jgi:hypothetical protein